MNSKIISEILEKYNQKPYYKSGEYLSINDDRIGRIVSFKLFELNDNIYADFKEISKNHPTYYRNTTNIILSLEDFQKKWFNFFNNIKDI